MQLCRKCLVRLALWRHQFKEHVQSNFPANSNEIRFDADVKADKHSISMSPNTSVGKLAAQVF